MDQLKIGEYIAKKRKMLNLTQSDLAEKLGITDRAISKWENGICMPDASNIPYLCEILDISINDLFSGDDVDMKDYKKQAEDNMLSLKKTEEELNKKLMFCVNTIGISSTLFFVVFSAFLAYYYEEDIKFLYIFIPTVIVYLIFMFIALRIDASAGYQECKCCHYRFKPTFKEVFLAFHIGYTRKLRCPKCGKKSWCKKVMSK